jgi:hypothetical protein
MSRYSDFLILNQGESYLSISLLLTAEAFGAYSTCFTKLITLDSYGRLDLIHMHNLFINTISKTCICINTYTPSLTQYLSELKSKYKDELHQGVSY